MIKLFLKGTAVDENGNTQDVMVPIEVCSQSSTEQDGLVQCSAYFEVSFFTVNEGPKFKVWSD